MMGAMRWIPLVIAAAVIGVMLEAYWMLDVALWGATVLVLAFGARWAWHRGLPRMRAWWNAGRG